MIRSWRPIASFYWVHSLAVKRQAFAHRSAALPQTPCRFGAIPPGGASPVCITWGYGAPAQQAPLGYARSYDTTSQRSNET
ncbi:MAG: hypothetical protein H0U76_27405 [Ktedonobacteraceae bacterium]|nr:hypothetical protein [Ktedonobacteraceae bacterium]